MEKIKIKNSSKLENLFKKKKTLIEIFFPTMTKMAKKKKAEKNWKKIENERKETKVK